MPMNFNFNKTILQLPYQKIAKAGNHNPDNVTYPMNVTHFQSGFSSLLRMRPTYLKYQTITLDQNHHEKYNYQGIKYLIHSPYELFTKQTSIHQSITNHSIIVYLNPKKVIIDKALESYEFKRYSKRVSDPTLEL
jgi:hypothetical protein